METTIDVPAGVPVFGIMTKEGWDLRVQTVPPGNYRVTNLAHDVLILQDSSHRRADPDDVYYYIERRDLIGAIR